MPDTFGFATGGEKRIPCSCSPGSPQARKPVPRRCSPAKARQGSPQAAPIPVIPSGSTERIVQAVGFDFACGQTPFAALTPHWGVIHCRSVRISHAKIKAPARGAFALAEAVGFESTRAFTLPDFEFFENLGKHRKSASFSRKITEAQKRSPARLFSAPHTPKTTQTQEIHRLEIGSKVLSKFSPGGQKSGTLERTQERTHPPKGIRDSSCR